ncbi:MAG: hypothetical protein EXR72_12705 [Myxococcales bacterium]|nr:hypothetical protein [Myxococcales bacterium]
MPRKALLLSALCTALGASACDRLSVTDFAGAKIELTLSGAAPTAAGQHLELWARDGNQHVIRLLAGSVRDECGGEGGCINNFGYHPALSAYAVAPVVDLDDPCMIDDRGNLLWKPEAQPGPSDAERQVQAAAVVKHILQFQDLRGIPTLALVSYDDNAVTARPKLAADASSSERLGKCIAYWRASPFAYTGSPGQLTAPLHGQLFGLIDFASITPPQSLGGIQLITDYFLRDLRELWFTQTGAKVAALDPDVLDCKGNPDTCRGTLFLQGNAGTPARGIYHFNLSSRQPGVGGTASVYTRLDEDAVQF